MVEYVYWSFNFLIIKSPTLICSSTSSKQSNLFFHLDYISYLFYKTSQPSMVVQFQIQFYLIPTQKSLLWLSFVSVIHKIKYQKLNHALYNFFYLPNHLKRKRRGYVLVVHTHCTVNHCIYDCGCADYHTIL